MSFEEFEQFEKIVSEKEGERAIYFGRDSDEHEEMRRILDAILATLSPRDQAKMELWLRGGLRGEWVECMGIEQLSVTDQRKRINTEKGRLMKKVRRRVRRWSR